MKAIKLLFALAVVGALAALAFVYSGIYPIGADVPHTKFVDWALETLRERSIAARLDDIAVPPLDDSQMLRTIRRCCGPVAPTTTRCAQPAT